MRATKKCQIETIERVLDKFFYGKELPRRMWIAQEDDGSWTVVDNEDGYCRTENFKTEFAARLRMAWYREDAEYIRWY